MSLEILVTIKTQNPNLELRHEIQLSQLNSIITEFKSGYNPGDKITIQDVSDINFIDDTFVNNFILTQLQEQQLPLNVESFLELKGQHLLNLELELESDNELHYSQECIYNAETFLISKGVL